MPHIPPLKAKLIALDLGPHQGEVTLGGGWGAIRYPDEVSDHMVPGSPEV